MKALLLGLLLLPFSLMAAPIQPSDLQDDDFGDVDVFVMCVLAGACVDDVPLVSFMTTVDNITPTQLEIDAANKTPFNFNPFTGEVLPGSEMTVARTDLGFVYGTTEGSVLTPDEWVQLLVFDGNQWTADIGMTQTGPDSFLLDFPTQDTLLIVDASTEATVVPIPPAIWLFGAGLLGMVGVARPKRVN